MVGESRYYENAYREEDDELYKGINVKCAKSITRIVDLIQHKRHRTASIYTGSGGIALMYMRLALTAEVRATAVSKSQQTCHPTESVDMCYQLAVSICRDAERTFDHRIVTFLEGASGSLALQCCLFQKLKIDSNLLGEKLMHIGTLAATANGLPDEECELLYGRAGYLYTVAYVRHAIKDSTFAELPSQRVLASILREGLSASPGVRKAIPLYFEWHKSCYLGAAHGYAGILMVMLYFLDDLPVAESLAGLTVGAALQHIEHCVLHILNNMTFPSGNVKSSSGSESDRLVHWCHGAPGYIPLLAKCAEVFPHNKTFYLNWVERMGDEVWTRGLLRKGLGLCHGIGGNGLSLLCAYKATKDGKWLKRAQCFALFGMSKFDDLEERPDRPYSLFEGMAGFVVFLSELLHPESAVFPGFEI